MWLKRVYQKDRLLGLVVGGILCLYVLLHLLKIELYPLYLYAMYSMPAYEKEHVVYGLTNIDGDAIALDQLPYRQYTHLQNLLANYDHYQSSADRRPDISVIEKMLNNTRQNDTAVGESLRSVYNQDKSLDYSIQLHLRKRLCYHSDILVERQTYVWTDDEPRLIRSTIIHP